MSSDPTRHAVAPTPQPYLEMRSGACQATDAGDATEADAIDADWIVYAGQANSAGPTPPGSSSTVAAVFGRG